MISRRLTLTGAIGTFLGFNAHAALPVRLRRARWLLRHTGPEYARLPRVELSPLMEKWPLEGPQTWEQRKWRRIENARPFANSGPGHLRA